MKKITNIDLMSIKNYKFPITAICSIFHRISGLIMTISIPFVIVSMYYSLAGPVGYKNIVNLLTETWVSLFFWLFMSSVVYHIYAGIRHIIMDLGFGDSMVVAKASSFVVIILGILSSLLLGFKLWL